MNKKWEYKIISKVFTPEVKGVFKQMSIKGADKHYNKVCLEMEVKINKLSSEGWELINSHIYAIHGVMFILRRELKEKK